MEWFLSVAASIWRFLKKVMGRDSKNSFTGDEAVVDGSQSMKNVKSTKNVVQASGNSKVNIQEFK